MSSLTCTRLALYTIAAVLVQIIGLSLFIFGFFPVKPALSGVSGPESYYPPGSNSSESQNVASLPSDQLKSLYRSLSEMPPLLDRLILMVVDGLPGEFVLGKDGQPPQKAFMEAMPYTQSLLAEGMAIGYHAKAAPPTVTMPRLKAMMSGAIGGFLDVAFNFNTQALLDDNLIGQFFKIGWKMVMLGDETWLKLFPGLFTRHDGVSSFFVKDTVQVDYNVSRHLSDELNRTDWNLLILHYLGLDHVGHIGGRSSVLMEPKLKEMDEVVKRIHSSSVMTRDNDQGKTLLLVLSDHGMTENGNHGGSSYEETDSLALFIGLQNYNYTSDSPDTVYQVDIASTLALLFGVPIPKNNVGVLIEEAFNLFTDEERLRALELNSWQLLRLLHAQLPDLSCGNFSHDVDDDNGSGINKCDGCMEDIFCCLYSNAAALHKSWKAKAVPRSNGRNDSGTTILAYHDFLRTASEWLSRRATDKPVALIASGVATMLLSSLALLGLLFRFCQEVDFREKDVVSDVDINMHKWHFDEIFAMAIIFIAVLSMASSSFIEEEQCVWYFVISTFHLLLLRKSLQSIKAWTTQSSRHVVKASNKSSSVQMCSIIVIIVSGRILRGWHQGGVNWAHLPDISKSLEASGSAHIKWIQVVSVLNVISLGLFVLSLCSKKKIVMVVKLIFLFPGLLLLQNIIPYHNVVFEASNTDATLTAQILYAVLGLFAMGIAICLPWLMPCCDSICSRRDFCFSTDVLSESESKLLLVDFRDSMYIIGWGYMFCWCLLQLLLQQPINSMPITLLLIQILASVCYFSNGDSHAKKWVEAAALFYLGMAGHFGLGNTNTLATIDVAGAFIGVSSHSTLFSGILMFNITYASPMLVLLGMVMYISTMDGSSLENACGNVGHLLKTTVGFPCLVPLGLNSILLIAYTIMLLLMRNHLFIWSVFSPKYLYVCATTVCVYIGVFIVASTGIYTCLAFALCGKLHGFVKMTHPTLVSPRFLLK